MKIRIKNIGPIKEANIDFKDKVVIVGGNSSGKTFISTVAYFLITLPNMLAGPLKYKLELQDIKSNNMNTLEVPVGLKELIEENKDIISKRTEGGLKSVFGANIKDLIRFEDKEGVIESDKIKIVLHGDDVNVEAKTDEKVNFNVTVVKTSTELPICSSTSSPEGKVVEVFIGGRVEECLENALAYHFLMKLLMEPSYYPVTFLSTERIASALYLPNLNKLILPPVSASLGKPLIADFLKYIIPGKFVLLGHEVEVGKDFAIKVYKGGKEVNPSLVSTGIYQFIPVELALRNPILRTVIIEEPEINLHVDAQIEVAKRLANENTKKLFITTHSEWIPMFMAKVGKTEGLKVYEIVEGELKERKIDEEGFVETFETIFPKANEGIEELLQAVRKANEIK
ncbi:MAG: AAA family ATPase [Sulfolobaceae archaeon]|nr:AAA family ATPase [Sulfolobaceae archaeon]